MAAKKTQKPRPAKRKVAATAKKKGKAPPARSAKARSPKAKKVMKSKTVIRNINGDQLMARFQSLLMKDGGLQDELRLMKSGSDAAALAQKLGFPIAEGDFTAMERVSMGGLSEGDLSGVLGAAPCWCNASVVETKSCKSSSGSGLHL